MAEGTPAPKTSGSSSQLIMIMMLFLTLFIMFDPSLRNAVGNIAGIVLEPIIGFNGEFPVVTVMFAGFLMVTFSTGLRHFFIDWTAMAEKQQKMKDFNKTLRKARMDGNQAEVQRLMKKQMEMTKDTMSSTMDQMKPMMFTMVFLIATFAFIGAFLIDIPGATLSVPWANNVDMNGSVMCGFSNWILVYFLISISMAQVIQRALKWYSFSNKLKNWEDEPEVVEEISDETDDEGFIEEDKSDDDEEEFEDDDEFEEDESEEKIKIGEDGEEE